MPGTGKDEAFSVAAEREGATLCLTLAGDFDRAAIGRVEAALAAGREPSLEHLVFDLSGLTFLDVSGLRTLLKEHERAQADSVGVTVIRPRGLANRVFTLTRAGEILSMTDR